MTSPIEDTQCHIALKEAVSLFRDMLCHIRQEMETKEASSTFNGKHNQGGRRASE